MRLLQKRLALEAEPLVSVHPMDGVGCLPVMAQLEMALAAWRHQHGAQSAPVELAQVELARPLVVEANRPLLVRVVLQENRGAVASQTATRGSEFQDGESSFLLVAADESRQQHDEAWAAHARGKFVEVGPCEAPRVDLQAIAARCGQSMDVDEVYQRLADGGIEYGPLYRSLRDICAGEDEYLARLEFADGRRQGDQAYHLHPALAEGAWQLVLFLACANSEHDLRVGRGWSIGRIGIHGALQGAAWCHARRAATAAGAVSAVTVFGDDGTVIFKMEGIALRTPMVSSLATPPPTNDASLVDAIRDWFCEVRWEPEPLGPLREVPKGTWLVLVDQDGVGERLCQQLRRDGHQAIEVRAGKAFTGICGDRCEIDASCPEDYRRLVQAARDSTGDLRGALHLWTCKLREIPDLNLENLDERLDEGLYSLLHLTQQLAATETACTELWIVSTDSQAVEGSAARLAPERAPQWGLARVAAKEFSHLAVRGVDFSSEGASAAELADSLYREFRSTTVATEIAYRGGHRLARSLAWFDASAEAKTTWCMRRDGVYLVSGGQAGVGLELAESLARDARPRLVLVQRTLLPPEETWDQWIATHAADDRASQRLRGIRRLREVGALVLPVAADVADLGQMRRVVADVVARFGRIDGVIHSAGVLEDCSLANMDRATMHRVLRPKVHGSLVLEMLTRDMPLDFFVLCSSISSMISGEGQANHAAANCFQDALAHACRAAHGQKMTAINWGFWGETGSVANAVYRRALAAKGVRSIPNGLGQRAFRAALSIDRAQVGIAALDGDRLGILPQAHVRRWQALKEAGERASRHALADADRVIDAYGGLDDAYDIISEAYSAACLEQLGLPTEPAPCEAIDGLAQHAGVLPRYRQLLAQLIAICVEDRRIAREGEHYRFRVDRRPAADEPSRLMQEAAARYPQASAELALLKRCGERMADVLVGKVNPLELLFPSSTSETTRDVYRDSPYAGYFRDVIQASVRAATAHLPCERTLRVLEIGAGTGATSEWLLPALPADRTIYEYTDISRSFTLKAEERFSSYSFVKYETLDIERDPLAQGFAPRTYDLVIAANVLHATRRLETSIAHLRQLLSSGGIALILEATRAKRYALVTVGLTDGWWRFEDVPLRGQQPLLNVEAWTTALMRGGFSRVACYPYESSPLDAAGKHLIVAMADRSGAANATPLPPTAEYDDVLVGSATVEKARLAARDTSAALDAARLDTRLRALIRDVFSGVLRVSPDRIGEERTFQELGVDSLLALEAVKKLRDVLAIESLSPAILFQFSTVGELAENLLTTRGDELAAGLDRVRDEPAPARAKHDDDRESHARAARIEVHQHAPCPSSAAEAAYATRPDDMAVIGYACRFPRGANARQYWENLRAGVDCIGRLPAPRAAAEGAAVAEPHRSASQLIGGFLDDVESFDPLFFRISPAEAEQMEPRQKLFLQTAYEAAEHAGYGGERLSGLSVGVFVGAGALLQLDGGAAERIDEHWVTGLTPSVLASRVSYFLNLRGPCLTVDTACSSSLVALHLAISSLRRAECQFALVGGVHLNVRPLNYSAFEQMGALAADRRVKAFDHRADGFVPGEGVGVVLLRPVAQALAARDCIYGVIKGSATNNDGHSNGLTAPNPGAQADVICAAWHDAGIDPETLSYIEAHGTGTALGDPIEVQGLEAAFARFTRRRQFCRLGSVKSNVGHCEPAAGMASLIKVLLAMEHGHLPPTLHFESPNRHIRFENSPLVPNERLFRWRREAQPRRAGINSFGISGTNIHVVVEEPPEAARVVNNRERPWHVLPLSARTHEALAQLAQRFATHLEVERQQSLADVCFTAATGRARWPHRLVVVAEDADGMSRALSAVAATAAELRAPAHGASDALTEVGPTAASLRGLTPTAQRMTPTPTAQHATPTAGSGTHLPPWDPGATARVYRGRVLAPRELAERLKESATAILEHLEPAARAMLLEWCPAVAGEGVIRGQWSVVSEEVAGMLRMPTAEARTGVACEPSGSGEPAGARDGTRSVPATTDHSPLTTSHSPLATHHSPLTADHWYQLVSTVAQLWVWGVEVDWDAFDRAYHRQRVPLPAYPFARERPARRAGRAQLPPSAADSPLSDDAGASALGDWFHETVWTPRPLHGRRELPRGTWVVMRDELGIGGAVCRRLEKLGQVAIEVAAGRRFQRFSPTRFAINPEHPEGYTKLARQLSGDVASPFRGVIHLWNCTEDTQDDDGGGEALDGRLCDGVFSLVEVTKALTLLGPKPWEFWIVATHGQAVDSSAARVAPEKAAAWALLRSIGLEHSNIRTHAVDLDIDSTSVELAPECLLAELHGVHDDREVVYRDGRRFVPRLVPFDPARHARRSVAVRRDGVYLVTGGLGDLGLEVAEWLVSEHASRIVLIGRSGLPTEDAWQEWLASHSPLDPTSAKIRRVMALRSRGADIWPVACDAADLAAMSSLLEQIHERYGRISGVIHAAGVLRDSLAMNTSRDDFQAVLRPKVHGAWVLDQVTWSEPLDFVVYFSSVASVFGRVGQAAYAAANAFLDASACVQPRHNAAVRMALNWGPWSEIGMAVRETAEVNRADGAVEMISPALGRQLLAASLAHPAPRIVIFKGAPAFAQSRQADESSDAHSRGTIQPSAPTQKPESAATPPEASLKHRLRNYLTNELSRALGVASSEILPQVNFQELGLDSMLAVRVQKSIGTAAGVRLDTTLLFSCPTVAQLVDFLLDEHRTAFAQLLSGLEARTESAPAPTLERRDTSTTQPMTQGREAALPTGRSSSESNDIAIIAVGCRFPGANSPDEYWANIRAGVDSVGTLPPARRQLMATATAEQADSEPPIAGGFLEHIEYFDAKLFGIPAREARRIDPQHRVLLEVVWHLIERAGYEPSKLGRTGVFVGVSSHEYLHLLAAAGAHLDAHAASGTSPAMLANRISYLLNLQGPSITLDTACSSSLVAVHLACQSLRRGECDAAVAGGVNLILSPGGIIVCREAGMLSAGGRSRAFDDRADGYVRSEGAGAVLLKRLSDAIVDGDQIWAVIKSTAINHDGHSKVGLTAPNRAAQRDVVLQALAAASVEHDSIGLLEAHGTGTSLGDPIEVHALVDAFTRHTSRRAFCAIGSVKSNIGHLEPAAGIAGLVKAVLALRFGELPPTAHINCPNRHITFEESPFYLNDLARAWPKGALPRRAGVSSFGFGGTNVHAILEEPPQTTQICRERAETTDHLLVLSARSDESLTETARRFTEFLADESRTESFSDICCTAAMGRVHHSHRLAIVAYSCRDAAERLRAFLAKREAQADNDIYAGHVSLAAAEPEPGVPTNERQAATLYVQGVEFDWQAVFGKLGVEHRRVLLPATPLERERYWIDAPGAEPLLRYATPAARLVDEIARPENAPENLSLDDWLYHIVWQPCELPRQPAGRGSRRTWLVFADSAGLGAELAARLRSQGDRVVSVCCGPRFVARDGDAFELNPDRPEDYQRLFAALAASGQGVDGLVHLWACDSAESAPDTFDELDAHLADGVLSLFHIVKAFSEQTFHQPLGLSIVTRGAQSVAAPHSALPDCRSPEAAAMWGLARVIAREMPMLRVQCIDTLHQDADLGAIAEVLVAELAVESPQPEIAYRGARRYVPQFRRHCERSAETVDPTTANSAPTTAEPWAFAHGAEARRTVSPHAALHRGLTPTARRRDSDSPFALVARGVYLITGGLGGIGMQLARWLAKYYQARLVLVGRTVKHESTDAVRAIRDLGGEVWTVTADVTDFDAMQRLVDEAVSRFGTLNGVFHAAGVMRHALIKNTSLDEFRSVLAPKITGAWVLDRVTRNVPLDFMVLFSSLAGLEGNIFQGDYSAANRYLDSFAAWRTAAGRPTLSIAWGIWDDVGMTAARERATVDVRASADDSWAAGLRPMPAETGLAALSTVLSMAESHMIVADLAYRVGAVRSFHDSLRRKTTVGDVETLLIKLLSEALEVSESAVDPRQPFWEMGVDSVLAAQLARRVNQLTAAAHPRTLFFDYPTVERLAAGLVNEHNVTLIDKPIRAVVAETLAPAHGVSAPVSAQAPNAASLRGDQTSVGARPTARPLANQPIAVIGMAGRFAGAVNLDEFWSQLRSGSDLVTEARADRWDVDQHYDPQRQSIGMMHSKWGSFLDRIDQFDADFFHISPREAAEMDPQQRLLLEVTWEALESAAYAGSRLSSSSTGVFVAAMRSEYLEQAAGAAVVPDVYSGTGNAPAMIANRISYFLNLRGPCLTVDTACSSALVALHLAIGSLRRGECQMAIVGAAQAGLGAGHYQVLSRLGALAAGGRCRTFDRAADGYVPGEGVGAVLLKPLASAIDDGDAIQAVILGTAVNHGGQAAGITVPNSAAQADVIRAALADAGVDARSIGYIEAHGTGTALGDPIEVEGLARAFGAQTSRRQFCAIGSVKSNLGHLEAAAGMASLLKVILALKAGLIPPTLHVQEANPDIRFEAGPCYVSDRLAPWPLRERPRLASISSFGFGGTNAHLIVQESPEVSVDAESRAPAERPLHLLAISAQTADALAELAERLRGYVAVDRTLNAADICFTLNTGRAHLNHRAAIMFKNVAELESRLSAVASRSTAPGLMLGTLTTRRPAQVLDADQVCKAISLVRGEDEWRSLLANIGEQYVHGVEIDWDSLDRPYARRRVALPTYPFRPTRHWIGRSRDDRASLARASELDQGANSTDSGEQDATMRDEWFWHVNWEPQPLTAQTPLARGPWVVMAHDGPLGGAVCRRLAARGCRPIRVTPGTRFTCLEGDAATIDPASEEDYASLVRELRLQIGEPRGVVHLWMCRPDTAPERLDLSRETLDDELTLGVYSLFHLVRAFESTGGLADTIQMAVATCDSQPAGERLSRLAPPRAAAWTLGRIVPLEYEKISTHLVDFDLAQASPEAAASTILDELCTSAGSQAAYRAQQRLVPKLTHQRGDAAEGAPPIAVRHDGVYLIAGGLGHVGARLAEFIARQGNPTLVLLSRTTAHDETESPAAEEQHRDEQWQRIRRLRAVGATVWPVAGAVADAEAMRRLVAEIQARYGRLDGVIHAAGVLSDAALWRKTTQSITEVLNAKVWGSWALDEATRHVPLDFFVLCASMSATVGGAGHAAYAAANAFEDSLAHFRRRVARLPAIAIDWGVWSESPAGSIEPYQRAMKQSGVRGLSDRESVAAFARVLRSNPIQVGIVDLTAAPATGERKSTALWGRALDAAQARARDGLATLQKKLDIYDGLGETFDRLAAAFVADALAAARLFADSQRDYSLDEIGRALRILPRYSRLLPRLLRILLDDGVLDRRGELYRRRTELPARDSSALVQAAVDRYPSARFAVEMLARCGTRLASVLAGEQEPLELLFPAGSSDDAEAIFATLPWQQFYHRLAAAALAAVARHRDATRPLQVLEIGGGTGGTTGHLLPVLNSASAKYVFTDISPTLVGRAQSRFGEYPFVEFRVLDIELDPRRQGFDAAAFDVVIAANVLHATRRIEATLSHVRRLLAPGGILILIESTTATRFGDLTFGLTQGWWRFEDSDLRTDSPLLSRKAWLGVLAKSGFAAVEALPDASTTQSTEQHVLLALADLTDYREQAPLAQPQPHEKTAAHLEAPAEVEPVVQDGRAAELLPQVRAELTRILAGVLRCDPSAIDVNRPFQELGVDSLMALEILKVIKDRLGIAGITPPVLFDHATVLDLAAFLVERHRAALTIAQRDKTAKPSRQAESASPATAHEPERPAETRAHTGRHAIAVVGCAGRFPGAANLREFWRNLERGVDSVGPVPAERWKLAQACDPTAAARSTSRDLEGGFLHEIDLFDPLFFHISPLEASQMDPRQRLFLETAYTCAEHAGYGGSRLRGTRTGVFVGSGASDYVAASCEQVSEYSATGSSAAILPSRVAYFMDLHGPCVSLDAACSSSLLAVHMAVRALRSGECDFAIAGGVHLNLRLANFGAFRQLGALAASGRCRAFDRAADGFVPSEGVGAVLLRPLEDAQAAGDTIYGVILGSAANNDGRTNGLTAPSAKAQCDVLTQAWRDAGIDPQTLATIEAHGTGTALGDPIEIEGLAAAFGQFTRRKQFCRLGAVKTNIGHAEAAAGIAGLLKLLLALRHETIPATLHFNAPNTHLDLAATPLVVADRRTDWPRGATTRRGGVSAFGFGGTNVHVVVEEAPRAPRRREPSGAHVLCLSACAPEALAHLAQDMRQYLGDCDAELADICFTANTGRAALKHRLAIIARHRDQLSDRLHLLRAWDERGQLRGSLVFTGPLPGEPSGDDALRAWLLPVWKKLSHESREIVLACATGPPLEGNAARLLGGAISEEGAETTHDAMEAEVDRLRALALLFVLGAEINWDRFHAGQSFRRVELPTYPFERQSYWLGIAPAREPRALSPAAGASENLLYQVRWHERSLDNAVPRAVEGTWLLCDDRTRLGAAIERRLTNAGASVIRVEHTNEFTAGAQRITLVRDSAAEYARLFETVKGRRGRLAGIVDLWGFHARVDEPSSLDELENALSASVERLFHFAQVLASAQLHRGLDFSIVTAHAQRVRDGDIIAAERAAQLGLAQTLPFELKGLRLRAIDAELSCDPEYLAEQLLREISADASDIEIAYRGGARFVRELTALGVRGPARATRALRERGLYLVTGGLGGIGVEVARLLAGRARARIVLAGRSALPPVADWDRMVAGTTAADDATRRRLSAMREIESLASDISYVQADVSKPHDVTRLFDHIRRRHGHLDGVFHLAGLIDQELLALRSKSLDSFRAVMAPKVQGSWLLWQAVKAFKPDLFVLVSSVSSISGVFGASQCDYSTASRFQNAMAARLHDSGVRGAKSILLSEWASHGMLVHTPVGPIVRQLGLRPFSNQQALATIEQALSLETDHVVVISPDPQRFAPERLFQFRAAERTADAPAAPLAAPSVTPASGVPLFSRASSYLKEQLAAMLKLSIERIDTETNFMELGFDSIIAVQLRKRLLDDIGVRVDATTMFRYPSVRQLARHLVETHRDAIDRSLTDASAAAEPRALAPGVTDAPWTPAPNAAQLRGLTPARAQTNEAQVAPKNQQAPSRHDIAVIGLACRLPGAATPEEFWTNLCGGRDSVTPLPSERLKPGRGQPLPRSNGLHGGYLDDIDQFDPAFFHLSRREARLMDPQQRLFLEVAWEACERAGYRTDHLARGRVGVFVGASTTDYVKLMTAPADQRDPHLRTGNALSMIANRVSYLLDWHGPSLSVDTACSSSLVALHLACQCLRQGEADFALAGAVHLILNPAGHELLGSEGVLAADGRSKAFDDRADGFARGEGVVAILLKPLDAALADRDQVWAVIKATAVNNDGHSKAGLAAPNPKAQRDVILSCLQQANIGADTIGLFEAHGTGTALGDPIEIDGAAEAFARHTSRRGYCAIGSVKSNLGHLEAAAGMAGFAKAVLALKFGQMPPTIHFEVPNRHLCLEETPFFIVDRLKRWPAESWPHRAGVSSFGFGGTNAHVLVEAITNGNGALDAESMARVESPCPLEEDEPF